LALTGLLVSFLFGALVPFSLYTLGDLFSVRPILTALTLITIFLSLILPFTLRFGMKGLLIFLVVMQVLGVVLLTVARVTQSSLDRRIVEGITGFFRHLREALGPTGFNLAMLAVLLVLFSASYLVSAWSFRNREL
jgi:hypothetical protein